MKLLIALFVLTGSVAMADQHEGKGEKFEEIKKKAIASTEERIAKLQENKACISAATNPDGMRACQEKMREFRMEKREEHLENRKMKIDEKLKKMQDKKQSN